MIKSRKDYLQQYRLSVTNPKKFWEKYAKNFHWHSRFSEILDWNFEEPKVEWFCDGKLNITENIFERKLFQLIKIMFSIGKFQNTDPGI